MESVKFSFIFIFISITCRAKTVLPEFITKQAIENIRFLSVDGKYTYYKRYSGSLLMETNYKVETVIKGNKGDNYDIKSSPSRKRLLILHYSHYHDFTSSRIPHKIYVSNFGQTEVRLIGKGRDPQLHLNDTWASYYDYYKKSLFFVNLINSNLNFKIRLLNSLNPYFTPQRVMIDPNRILFTDLNKKGHPGVLLYIRGKESPKLFYKIPSHLKKIEICLRDKEVIFSEFGLDEGHSHSMIFSLSRDDLILDDKKILYNSKVNDIGNLICNLEGNNIYFIKKSVDKKSKISFNAASLHIPTKKIKIISDVNFASQLINMDGKLLLPYQNKYYVLLGEEDMTKIDRLRDQK